MRRRNHYGYGAYRGRSKFRTFLKFVIAVLAVVLALLVGAFFFLQRYMVVSSTGGIYFDLPFLDREKTERFLTSPADYGRPWYGQLMAAPQMMAYVLQLNDWLRKYSVEIL